MGKYPVIDQSKEYIVGYTDHDNPLMPQRGYIVFGDHTRELKYVDFPFYTGADGTQVLNCKNDAHDSLFVYYLCLSLNIPNTGYNRHLKYLKESSFAIPSSIDEQRFIASYFRNLDKTISVKKHRLEHLRQLKLSCLNNLFVNTKENTPPRLRFMGFEGDWIMVRFSDIATIRRGLTYSPDNICESGIRVLRSSNINEDAFALSSSDVFVDQRCVNIPLAKHNDILITAANGSPRLVGKHCLVECEKDKMVPGGFMYLVSSDEPEFLNACMGAKWYKDFLVNGVSGGNGAIGNLSKDELEKCQFYIPKEKSERDCIASFFTKLDKQLSLQDIQLKKLEQLKKACLNQMIA